MSSDLKVTNIKHASSGSNNLVLGSDGTTTTTLSSSANIKSAINASGSAPIFACRAWVNFNGTGTVAIRDSGNVTSITDQGTGKYDVNLTTAVTTDACVLVSTFHSSLYVSAITAYIQSTTSIRVLTGDYNGTNVLSTLRDNDYVHVSVVGN